jgi:hypothetical protein
MTPPLLGAFIPYLQHYIAFYSIKLAERVEIIAQERHEAVHTKEI